MYTPAHFALPDEEAWRILSEAGAGFLLRSSPTGLRSVFVPLVVLDGAVVTHVARANDWWRDAREGEEVLVAVNVASAYVSPRYYPSRLEDPRVVPTWNYVVVEARGHLSLHEDREWLASQVRRQTERFEGDVDPWRVDQAPADYLERQLAAIVGLTVAVSSITGKAKLSQNRPDQDRREVRRRLGEGSEEERRVASWMPDA